MEGREYELHGLVSIERTKALSPSTGSSCCPNEAQLLRDSQGDAKSSELQASFEKVVCKELEIPFKYQHVAVLIIRWADYLDRDLKSGDEVKELNHLFENEFYFSSKVLILDDNRKPQLQLIRAISELVDDNNGSCRTNLLIVYYTGHAFGDDEDSLIITGVRDPSGPASGSKFPPRANWNQAETSLRLADADVLTILDSCSAGSVIKGVDHDEAQVFQVLAAAGRQKATAAPGPRSFSRALIDTLHEQLENSRDKPFTTYDLNQAIMLRRKNHTSHVFNRFPGHCSRFIKLAPLDNHEKLESPVLPKASSYLTLRFVFDNHMGFSSSQIETLAKNVSRGAAESTLGVRAIDWIDLKLNKAGNRLFHVATMVRGVKRIQNIWRERGRNSPRKRPYSDIQSEDERDNKRLRTPSTRAISPAKMLEDVPTPSSLGL